VGKEDRGAELAASGEPSARSDTRRLSPVMPRAAGIWGRGLHEEGAAHGERGSGNGAGV
jgi:hypothetical protein